MEVEGHPFPVFGAQIRLDALINCDRLDIPSIGNYFARAHELGVNCVQVPIWWRAVEPAENSFDFSLVDHVLALANKYQLRLELLWFSTNMIGDSFSYLVPDYILGIESKRLLRKDEGVFWGYYGHSYALILNDKWILERETGAITRLMDHIRKWDDANWKKRPVISVQVHNEPDGFVRWRMDQKEYRFRDGTALTKAQAWKMTLEALDAVGLAVKNSSYKVVTRVNLISGNGVDPYPEAPVAKPADVLALDGIDFISVDPYKNKVAEIREEVLAYGSLHNNYALVAENKGTYTNTPTLMLAAAALGSGYNIYDLATSKFFIGNASPGYKDQIDHGIYTWDLKEKPHTAKTRQLLTGLLAAGPDLLLAGKVDFAVFNVRTDQPQQAITESLRTSNSSFTFSSNNAAIGFLIDRGTYLLVYTTAAALIHLNNGTIKKVQSGFMNKEGSFTVTGDVGFQRNELQPAGQTLYRIQVAKKPSRNTE